MKDAHVAPSEEPRKSKGREEPAREPQVPPLKLAILLFMFLCKSLFQAVFPAWLPVLSCLIDRKVFS